MLSFNFIQKKNLSVFIWLLTLTFMTFIMILIGGLTRLTDSGLSMVDWRPIMGSIPPLNQDDWLKVFSNYQKSPEFQIINNSMTISEFKYIFWWEWAHRFYARCIGLVFLIPMIFFIFQKKISLKLLYNVLILFFFGIFQALIGWWMVKSGLTNDPYVSSYRLAFHLTNAVIILSILLWLTLKSYSNIEIKFLPDNKLQNIVLFLMFLIFITIITGAFMAGSNAGQSFNTYPLMNGKFIPEDYYINDYHIIRNFFENTVAINFNHRWLATITFLFTIFFVIYLYFKKKYINYKLSILLIFLFAILQFFLGILTLLTNVEIYLASLHQINSMLLLASFIFYYFSIKHGRIK